MKVCAFPSCKKKWINGLMKNNDNGRYTSFHRFPSDEELKMKWIKAIGRTGWTPEKHAVLCSNHFDDSCFLQGGFRKRLHRTAIPRKHQVSTQKKEASFSPSKVVIEEEIIGSDKDLLIRPTTKLISPPERKGVQPDERLIKTKSLSLKQPKNPITNLLTVKLSPTARLHFEPFVLEKRGCRNSEIIDQSLKLNCSLLSKQSKMKLTDTRQTETKPNLVTKPLNKQVCPTVNPPSEPQVRNDPEITKLGLQLDHSYSKREGETTEKLNEVVVQLRKQLKLKNQTIRRLMKRIERKGAKRNERSVSHYVRNDVDKSKDPGTDWGALWGLDEVFVV